MHLSCAVTEAAAASALNQFSCGTTHCFNSGKCIGVYDTTAYSSKSQMLVIVIICGSLKLSWVSGITGSIQQNW